MQQLYTASRNTVVVPFWIRGGKSLNQMENDEMRFIALTIQMTIHSNCSERKTKGSHKKKRITGTHNDRFRIQWKTIRL